MFKAAHAHVAQCSTARIAVGMAETCNLPRVTARGNPHSPDCATNHADMHRGVILETGLRGSQLYAASPPPTGRSRDRFLRAAYRVADVRELGPRHITRRMGCNARPACPTSDSVRGVVGSIAKCRDPMPCASSLCCQLDTVTAEIERSGEQQRQ